MAIPNYSEERPFATGSDLTAPLIDPTAPWFEIVGARRTPEGVEVLLNTGRYVLVYRD